MLFRAGNFIALRAIGRGAYSDVFQAEDVRDSSVVALKRVDIARLRRGRAQVESEIALLRDLDHPHIVRFIDAVDVGDALCIALEYCADGDLAHLIRKHPAGLGLERARRLGRQLLSALRYLHERAICHRDLKPQNILVRDGELKLSDFGFSRILAEEALAETACGSPLYMAPEILHGEGYTNRADLWSLGCVLYEMLFGAPPYGLACRSVPQLLRAQRNPLAFPRDHASVTRETRVLIVRLLQRDPAQRLDWHALLESRHWLSAESAPRVAEHWHLSRSASPCTLDDLTREDYAPAVRSLSGESGSFESRNNSVEIAEEARAFHLSTSPSRWITSTWKSLRASLQDALVLANDLRESA